MNRSKVTFVIMAGGRGERLWPFVRVDRPKVALPAQGGGSLLEATIRRLRPVSPRADWLVVTTREQAPMVRRLLPPRLRRCVLVEPEGKNTAACITLAAVALAAREPRRIMVVVPADHWVGDAQAFAHALRRSIDVARRTDALVTVGIRPTHAHPGLGYLRAGASLDGRSGPRVWRLAQFIEKPPPATARRLLARGRTFWNSGYFIGTADKFLECLTEWLPAHTQRLVPLARRPGRATLSRRAYRALASVSFDHGVMDHVRDGLVVEGRFPWADLGSWDVWMRHAPGHQPGVLLGGRNVRVLSDTPHLVAVIGVQNLVVVHTRRATLICRAGRTEAVRDVVARLAHTPNLSRFR